MVNPMEIMPVLALAVLIVFVPIIADTPSIYDEQRDD
jgi:hypothetical protein